MNPTCNFIYRSQLPGSITPKLRYPYYLQNENYDILLLLFKFIVYQLLVFVHKVNPITPEPTGTPATCCHLYTGLPAGIS